MKKELDVVPGDSKTIDFLAIIQEAVKKSGRMKTSSSDDLWEEEISRCIDPHLSGLRPGTDLPPSVSHTVRDYITIQPPRSKAVLAVYDGFENNGPHLISFDELLGALALWYLDLPASESHHHSGRFGLFDHSLEVALDGMTRVFREWQKNAEEADPESLQHAASAALGAGLLHDCGKLLDIQVTDPTSTEIWDPLREPLAFFKRRHTLRVLEPTVYRFRPGRGLNRHEKKGRKLAALILPSYGSRFIRDAVLGALEAYFCRYDQPQPKVPQLLGQVANFIHHADGASAATVRRKTFSPGGYLAELTDKLEEEIWGL